MVIKKYYLKMFEHIKDENNLYYKISAYYKALISREAGDTAGYQENINTLREYKALSYSEYEDGYAFHWNVGKVPPF